MSEFNLEKCIAGEAVETQANTPVYFIAYDEMMAYPLLVRIGRAAYAFTKNGDGNSLYKALRMVDKKKKVDWSKIPVDTVCNVNGILKHFATLSSSNVPLFYEHGCSSHTVVNSRSNGISNAEISIYDKQPWKFWQGGENPIPDGLELEVVTRGNAMLSMYVDASSIDWSFNKSGLHSMNEIIAYRLTGRVLNGWELS